MGDTGRDRRAWVSGRHDPAAGGETQGDKPGASRSIAETARHRQAGDTTPQPASSSIRPQRLGDKRQASVTASGAQRHSIWQPTAKTDETGRHRKTSGRHDPRRRRRSDRKT